MPPVPPQVAYLDAAMRMGTVSYNGFLFPPALSSKVQIEPVYESSGRVPKWYKHTLAIEFMIVPQLSPISDALGTTAVDVNTEAFKRAVLVPGARLTFSLQGLGTSEKDTASTIFEVDGSNDLDFGPRPAFTTWEAAGANLAVRVQWTVEFALPICCFSDSNGDGICDGVNDPTYSLNSVQYTEFNYSLSFAVDVEGWMQRNIIGSAEVPGHLISNTALGGGSGVVASSETPVPNTSLTANLFLIQNHITSLFPMLPGFHRSYQWDVSRDGRRIDWRITDDEIRSDNPYINGIIRCEATHAMESSLDRGFVNWDNTISGVFTVAPKVPRWLAWSAFTMVVQNRLLGLTLAAGNILSDFSSTGASTNVAIIPCYLPTSISIEEELYGRTFRFSFRFTVFCSWQQVLLATRMFTPLTGTGDWSLWRTNLPDELFTGRGTSNLSSVGFNNIVVRCTDGTPASSTTAVGNRPEAGVTQSIYAVSCPPPDKSWLDYKIWFTVESDANSAIHQKSFADSATMYLDTNDQTLRSSADNTPIHPYAVNEANANQGNPYANNVYQAVSGRRYRVTMHGYAIRACYDIPIPDLVEYGPGNKPIALGEKVKTKVRLSSAGPVPIYGASWHRTYELIAPPVGVPSVGVKTSGQPSSYLSGQRIGTNNPPFSP